jgi:hypothetical protein
MAVSQKIKEMLKQYEETNGKENTYELIEFLLNSYVGIIEQFGISLLKNGVQSQDIEQVIFQLIISNNRKRNTYQTADDDKKQVMDALGEFLSSGVMSNIVSSYQEYSKWENVSKTLQ